MVAAMVTQIEVEKSACQAFWERTATALAGPTQASAETAQNAALRVNWRRHVKAMAGTSEAIAVRPNSNPVCISHHCAQPASWQGNSVLGNAVGGR